MARARLDQIARAFPHKDSAPPLPPMSGASPLKAALASAPATPPVPLPAPPFVAVDGIENFRDVGGYPVEGEEAAGTESGPPARSVRRGLVFRSADPCMVTDEGRSTLAQLGITGIFDLRSANEVRNAAFGPPLELPACERHHAPVFPPERDANPEALALQYQNYLFGGPEGFARAYADMLAGGGGPQGAYRQLFDWILAGRGPVLVHCSAGKDRTGVACMLLLKAAGASDDTVCREYALTEAGMWRLAPIVAAHLARAPALAGKGTDDERYAAAAAMCGAKYAAMRATLAGLEAQYGGAVGYLRQGLGYSDAEVAAIRASLTVGEAAVLPEVPAWPGTGGE